MAKTNTTIRRTRLERWTFDSLAFMYLFIALALVLTGAKMALQHLQFARTVPQDSYQAVFLTNGQVYFGHLGQLNRGYWQLSDVYYVQENAQDPSTSTDQAASDVSAEDAEKADDSQSQFSIVRLGNELHEPTNQLVINRDHVLFWETLQADSRVIDAIQEEKKK